MSDCLVYPMLQKFYSSLEHLSSITPSDDIFQTISKLDAFFNDFRSITLMIQKSFGHDNEMLNFYKNKREEFLNNDAMKWFNDKRVETFHKNPFNLEKAIVIKTYPSWLRSHKVFEKTLTIDNDQNFAVLEKDVELIISELYKSYIEIFYSISIILLENGKSFDVNEKILQGIKAMFALVDSVYTRYKCNCKKCEDLYERINKLIILVDANNIAFKRDYYHSNDGETKQASQMYVHGLPTISLENNDFFGRYNDGIEQIFKKFVIIHCYMAKQQKELLSTFFILHKNKTGDFISFNSSLKTTTYRLIDEISNTVSSNGIEHVIWLTESVKISLKNKNILLKKYDCRVKEKIEDCLMFSLASKDFKKVVSIYINRDRLSDIKYLYEQINNPTLDNSNSLYPIFAAIHS